MKTAEEIRAVGKELKEGLLLRSSPIAIKVLHSRDEIPESCVCPSQAGEKIPAFCQTYSLVRRHKRHMAIFREDHWCVWPIVSLRLGEIDEAMENELGTKFFIHDADTCMRHWRDIFPRINPDLGLEGLALAPMESADFVPDCVVIYADQAQSRQLMMGAQFVTGEPVTASFDVVGSCMQAIVPVLNGEKDYNFTVPDDGEFERALTLDDEFYFTVSLRKLDEMMEGIRWFKKIGFGHGSLAMHMELEYPRPQFYDDAMKAWGLKQGELWKMGGRS